MNLTDLLLTGSISAIAQAIAQRRVKAVEVTRWFLERIERFNGGPEGINAVRTISPTAIASAERVDRDIAAGCDRGPLHGIPYLVKDSIFTADGTTAAAGAQALAGFVPSYAATVVERLEDAGAVLLGKTNLTEFADFVSDVMPAEFSGAGGVVRNPLGHRYERGQGSSVGSAAAVAARFCVFALGSETQNSIQAPAIHSSIVGFKPTVGLVSRHGIVPLVPSQDSPGPLTTCVEDARMVLRVIAGPDVRDTATLSIGHRQSPLEALHALRGLRIGIPRRFQADLALGDVRVPAMQRVLDALSGAGAVIVDPCDLPTAEQLHEVRSCVFRTEFKASLNALLAQLHPCGIGSMQDLVQWNGRNPDAIPYGQSLLEAANATTGVHCEPYLGDRQRDIALSDTEGITAAMRACAVDVLLAPMTAAAKCTGKAGAPVIAIPAGRDACGLPFGVTLFAMRGTDTQLLGIASAVEQVIGERVMPDLH